jgi:membrane associated rhomboid family serine protease
MFIPYSTDAPIYHWPIATVATIVVNVLAFVPMLSMTPDEVDNIYGPLILNYGWIYPWQWVTSNYVHAGIGHLVGNMIILWAFGLIVEGKIGWWKFLLLYNAIGIGECAIEQIVTLPFGYEVGSLGASAIIYGLIAIAMVWAPVNELNCFCTYGFRNFGTTVDISILVYASVSFAIEAILGVFSAVTQPPTFLLAAFTSQILHLLGGVVGFGVGAAMLKLHFVDCENYDLFSVWSGRHTMTPTERNEERLTSAEGQALIAEQRAAQLEKLRGYLAAGESAAALAVQRRALVQFTGWQLPEPEFMQLIAGLRKQQLWNDAAHWMNEYLKTYQQRAGMVRLALAQLLMQQQGRPGQALRVLAKIEPAELDASKQAILDKLWAQASAAAEEDPYEVVTDEF